MIAFSSVGNSDGSLFGEVLSVSGSRSQISIPRKFIFCHRNSKYGFWTNASLKTNAAPPALVTAVEEEAKVVLKEFLRKQGFSSAVATRTTSNSDLFVEHLVSRLGSLKTSGCPVGHELPATEIRDALIPYLELLFEDHESNLVDFLENFPNSPAKEDPVASIASADLIDSRKLKALSIATETGPDGQLPPHILYLLELGMDIEQIKKIICKYPYFTYLSLDGKVKPLVEFLRSLGLSNSEISSIVIKMPHLCVLRLPEKVMPIMKFLENLGLNKRQLAKVAYQFPNLFGFRQQKIEATVDFLYEMGLSAEGVTKVLARFPHITGYSVGNNLQPTADYFQSLGVRVDVVILKWPQAFALSIEDNLKPTTEFFLSKGYSREEVASMVSRCGGIYTLSLSKNLIPKWEFFLTMNYPKAELPKFPQYFSYSLEGRIKPRYAAVKASGVKFPLNHMLSLPDDKFVKTLEVKTFRQGLR